MQSRISSLFRTFIFILFAQIAYAQSFVLTPTTTMQAETANNTSSPDTFAGLSNGNQAAGSISKLPLRSLLYTGANTKIYAHFMPWFGQAGHIDVGYSSADASQVKKQVDDMQSRGIDGAIIDWYGPSHAVEENTSQLMKTEAESRTNRFEFAIMEDAGALGTCASTSGCDLTQQLVSDLTYAYNNYEQSPAYLLLNGRPAVFFFGLEQYSTIDWDAVRSQTPGNPAFIFRNSGSFTKPQTDGGFAWTNVNLSNPDDEGMAYLDDFYKTGLKYPSENTFAASYKGFNNTLASWQGSTPKIMNQKCGQVWLDSFGRVGLYYSSANQLPALQLVTWNDYEEGTEIESGIDNCVAVKASVAGTSLTWSITGQEKTVHHYTTFISLDGQNMMPLGDTATGAASYALDLSKLGLDPAKIYTLYVEAVGQPSMRNHFSNTVTFSPSNQPPKAAVTVTPSSGTAALTVTASTAGSTDPDGKIASSKINFGDGSAAVSATSANHTYSAAGTYTVTATVTDNAGASSQATAKVTASAPTTTASCTINKTNRTVTVCTPVNGGSYKSSVRVTASATDSAAVAYMQIYVDGIKVYQLNSVKSINTSIAMKVGSRRVTVQAKDATGTFWKTTTINVTQ